MTLPRPARLPLQSPTDLLRRRWLRQGAIVGSAWAGLALPGESIHAASAPTPVAPAAGIATDAALTHDLGPIQPPVPVPAIRLRMHNGDERWLADVLRDHTTAVQLMFTSCSATCPIQGFMFSEVRAALRQQPIAQAQLLSLSISPLEDDPPTLRRWLDQYGGADALWQAAAPLPEHYERMLRSLNTETVTDDDPHTGNIYLFDRQARLSFKSVEFPDVRSILETLQAIHERNPVDR